MMKFACAICVVALATLVASHESSLVRAAGPLCSFTSTDGSYFDLSKIATNVDYADNTSSTAYDYRLNVCAKVNEPNCNTKGGSICQYYSGGTGIVAVLATLTDPTWSLIEVGNPAAGIRALHTSGDKCWVQGQQVTRQVILNLVCDPKAGIAGKLVVTESTQACMYTATLPSALACPATPAKHCSFTAPDLSVYDLSSLHKGGSGDYVGFDNQFEYDMNVCGLSNSSLWCAAAGGTVCQYDKVLSRFVNVLGRYDTLPLPTWAMMDPHERSKGVSLRYANGDSCSTSFGQRQTTVNFVCDKTALKPTNFTVIENPPCIYTITMATAASCAPPPVSNCSFTSKSGARYDLASLFNGGSLPDYTGLDQLYSYSTNVCGQSATSSCRDLDGVACQYTRGTPNIVAVLARATASPAPVWSQIDDTKPSAGARLTFTNGDKCRETVRTTVYNFVCDPNAGRGGNFTVQETPLCQYNIFFPTAVSCPLSMHDDSGVTKNQMTELMALLGGK